MNLKKVYLLILLGLIAFAVTGCNNQDNTNSSVSEQDIQQKQAVENTSQLSVNDIDAQQQIVFETEGNYRSLDEKALQNYNRQYSSFKTMKYFYDDDKDTSIAIVKIYPLEKSKEAYFSELENKVKKSFPNAEYSQGTGSSNSSYDYVTYAYLDANHHLNNTCNVMLTANKTIYSICAISPSQSISFLKEVVKNISIKTIPQ